MKKLLSKRYYSSTIILVFSLLTSTLSFSAEAPKDGSEYKASLVLNRDDFDQGFDSWNQASFSLARRFSMGSVIARANQATRFNVNGTQLEVDAYPKFREGTYAYFNVGYSSSSIFPEFRYGAEIFQSLADAWETSLGFRYLEFKSSKITIYTGTVGKYVGDYYFLFRLNVIPEKIGTQLPQFRTISSTSVLKVASKYQM